MQFLSSLSSIASNYEAFILDLWGCVHDGSRLYPGAKECLKELRARGKKIVFLSNAPRRAFKVVAVLDALGVERELYEGVVTSGEAGYCALVSLSSPLEGERLSTSVSDVRSEGGDYYSNIPPTLTLPLKGGGNYYFIGPQRDADVLDGLPYTLAARLEEADFLLNAGFGSEEESLGDWGNLLVEAQKRGLPMLCLNPDMEVVKITGERFACAGLIAQEYEERGGKVIYFGKPYPEVYGHALRMLGSPDRAQALAVGDALHTDILGANNLGIASALVTGGILRQELGDADSDAVRDYLARQEVRSDYVLPGLVW